MDKGKLKFDVKAGMKNIIGRDLITDDFIAIYELVKNAYDAYADYVKITFEQNEIIIADNGKGMSKDDLEKKWFAVAYSAKKDNTEDKDLKRYTHLNNSKSRRFYAGAKGVGRFSCDRLGEDLELVTSKIESNTTYKVIVDWREFEKDAQQSFDSIEIPFEEVENQNVFPNERDHGTILKITNLNSSWDKVKLQELRRSLEKLIDPFSKVSSFEIEIEAKGFLALDQKAGNNLKINGVINNSILKVLELKTTKIELNLKGNTITTKIQDRGTLIYHIEEPNNYESTIDDLEIILVFLNRSAKVNFGKLMDIEPVKYGNVFLFKNGFRVQPYGDIGDDSWGLDNRKQQGYNRFLGTRDLFGKVDLVTEKLNEFKDVSSRDGGLIETNGKKILFEFFNEKAFLRLERYVVGVLWGEAFKRKKYFLNEEIAEMKRGGLKQDQYNDNYEDALSNIGSKIDFVNLIKTLTDDKEIEIIDYNKDLVNFVNEKLDEVQPKFISELEGIAKKTNDESLLHQVKLFADNYISNAKEKEDAERREEQERKRRIEAEIKADREKQKKEEAEAKLKEEEEKRRKAEFETLKKEKERAEAELAKLRAEQKEKEEKEKNKDLTDKLIIETKKNQYLNATRKTLSDDAEQLVHSIDLYVGNASTYVNELLTSNIDEQIKTKLYAIKNNIDKAIKVSQIIIKSNFDYKYTNQRIDLPKYISEYLEDLNISHKDLKIEATNIFEKFVLINPIEIDIILDNLVSNSKKAKAKNIIVGFSKSEDKIEINYYDDGNGVPELFLNNPEAIFELGVRDSDVKGSGIGLFDVRKRLKSLKGSISFLGNNKKLKGACFKITI
jgi:signal transduction histidine kinase